VTYSIVARDPSSGELGVAVQSHFFGVGPIVAWAQAGVGAVATQSFAEPAYGPRGLELMGAGRSAPEALGSLLAADELESGRQVAMIDRAGRVAVHTGTRCIAHAGHAVGDQVSAQANIMARDTVPAAMVRAYREAAGTTLVQRLLAALDAAEGEGGDLRGRQSAALLVVGPRATGKAGGDVVLDVRVDDHENPLAELNRLVRLQRAYERAGAGDARAAEGDFPGAAAAYKEASRAQPENQELAFWHGVSLASAGREAEARAVLEPVFARHPGWAELLRRLPAAGLFPDDERLIARLAGTRAEA
jgi:uncharacterized Ntn-hydrolase superfamily protein